MSALLLSDSLLRVGFATTADEEAVTDCRGRPVSVYDCSARSADRRVARRDQSGRPLGASQRAFTRSSRTAATAARPTPFTCSIVEEFWWPHATRRAKNQVARRVFPKRVARPRHSSDSTQPKPSGIGRSLSNLWWPPKRRHLRGILARVLRPQAQCYGHGQAVGCAIGIRELGPTLG